ncbi:hypothetical protein [Streptomyces sp. NBC_00576]|uniref:hypothetical protein n=1 Tax=Streptomyces sp. NBC_00576 TaxID=2903665 RepID=UPI002E80A254|nr:hypothetical protein [Streptomyces sp. NBC_00576]WUB72967.1 hypothetical protein OG734_24335 [Streptomyces sp. NBC_00576]
MNDHRMNTPGDDGDGAQDPDSRPKPLPRDMPDQQAGADGDPWEVDDNPAGAEAQERPDPQVPDTDEAGTGRRGAPHSGSRRPEHPVPDEPTA